MEFGAASRLQNFISFKRHKISARPPIRRRSAQTPACADEKHLRRNLFARRPLARDPPAPKSQSPRAAYEILKFHRPQSRAILSCDRPQSPYLARNSTLNVKLTHRASPLSGKKFRPLHGLQSGAILTPHPSPLTPHAECRVSSVECRKTQAVRSKIGKPLRQSPASGANFYFTAR